MPVSVGQRKAQAHGRVRIRVCFNLGVGGTLGWDRGRGFESECERERARAGVCGERAAYVGAAAAATAGPAAAETGAAGGVYVIPV